MWDPRSLTRLAPTAPALEARGLNYWTSRETPQISISRSTKLTLKIY